MLSKLKEKIKVAVSNCALHVKQRKLELLLFNNIENVPAKDWNCLVNDDVFWSIAYHKALQNGCSENVQFRYVLIYENEIPKALVYLQLIELTNKSLKVVLNPEYFEKIFSKMNGIGDDYVFAGNGKSTDYLCVCGNFFVSGNYGIAVANKELLEAIEKSFPKITTLISEGLEKGANIFATVLKDFDLRNNEIFNLFVKSGFLGFEIDPDMIIPIDKNWESYNDYLEAFSSKYRVRANNATNKAESIIVCEFNQQEIKKHALDIARLFNAVFDKAPVKIASNTSNYFYHLKNNLGDRFCFKAFLLEGKLVAFSTAVINSNCTHAHHIGLDYSLNKSYSLYQNILYQFVSDAIKNKSEYLNLGRDALEIKSTVGAIPFPLKLYVRFSNSFTHFVLESFTKLTQPREWTQRRPFKESGNQLLKM